MADPSLFDAIRIPADVLIRLDNRVFHFAMQPVHYLVRLVHVVAMGAFFGAIALVDLRLMGWRGTLSLRAFVGHALPFLYGTFAVSILTGTALFLFDPVRVGSHAYFAPKLVLIALGLGNALLFHKTGYVRAVAAQARPPVGAILAGAVSLALWMAVITCSSLNVEPMPKVFLR